MQRFLVSGCIVASLAACAAPPRPGIAAAMPTGERGTILAIRPVPASDPTPVQVLLARLGSPTASTDTVEYVVKREDGRVLAIVQRNTPGLQLGAQVLILPDMPAHILAIPAVAVR